MRQRLIIQGGASLALGLGLAVIGPYGTYDQLGFPLRLVYWCTIVTANWLQIMLFGRLARRMLPPPHWAPPVPVVLAACAASLPASGEVLLLEHWLRPGAMAAAGISFAELYFLVLVITLPVALVAWRWSIPDEPAAPLPPPEPDQRRPAAFLDRMPARLGRDLLCIRTEDHYLRVHTPLGDDLILVRMSDAEAELAGVDGLRVHRSWWVARSAVIRVGRKPGNGVELILSNGLAVPVSRNYLGAVRSAGWLAIG